MQESSELPDHAIIALLKREHLLTRAKLNALYFEHIMGERRLRSLKTQLRQVRISSAYSVLSAYHRLLMSVQHGWHQEVLALQHLDHPMQHLEPFVRCTKPTEGQGLICFATLQHAVFSNAEHVQPIHCSSSHSQLIGGYCRVSLSLTG